MTYSTFPEFFWNVISLSKDDEMRRCDGLCVGFEEGRWRSEEFARHVIEWIPEFVLPYDEYKKISGSTMIMALIKSSKLVYESEKYMKRGEFGEVFLHMAIRQLYSTVPLISKLYWKSGLNETVKGFDSVHVVKNKNDELELWLGEEKFYSDISSAMREAVQSIKDHLNAKYLRNEFILISNKIDDGSPYAAEAKKLISHNTSLDKIFKYICIPVFITYESNLFKNHCSESKEYIDAFKCELTKNKILFSQLSQGIEFKIPVFFFPLKEKKELIDTLHRKIKALQGI
ncbi:MAG: DUF1837 domain-containing protein [Desulfovibrio sp.]|uniref:HamA C-terminal domain-containing protein n=1 Tax=Desulfovibrio sp. TaxID=885 RepID=UPI002A3632F7|nr:DUF1837 domain-containing protein [Desulfovibrio sp.]MDY0260774.1 DUF1837 domain-containing protein [Desulfovibrio sp.]